ncbi:MAG: molecular chaperone HtpG, partial [Kiloniellales bacterium]
ACDRLRYLVLSDAKLLSDDSELKIRIASDPKARTLTVADNGIGMSRDELVRNLGTIARSGTAEFLEQWKASAGDGDKKGAPSQIGQFGVGFYSAFMVADRVTVESRRAGENQGWRWVSDGRGAFTIAPSGDAPARGTRITLHAKKGAEEFLDPLRLQRLIQRYSDHIAFPILVADAEGKESQANAASALWARPKGEIEEQQLVEFYRHVAHAFDEPWLKLHFQAEGRMEYRGLLFVPSQKPFDLFHPERRHGVKLYVKRVFITDDCAELLPGYLRFVSGVIDSEDLPLNISRELLQANPLLPKIRSALVKRLLDALAKGAKDEPESYRRFWENFGSVLKEGLYEDEERRETLLKLVRFRSTASDSLVGLADYVRRMKPGQEAIYYLSGENPAALARSPHLEGFKAKGVEVLLLSDPIDEFWLPAVGAYEKHAFRSVTRGGAELDKIADDEEPQESAKDGETPAEVDALIAYLKLALKDEVKDVRASARLTDSPVCLVADEGDLDLRFERLLKQHRQLESGSKRILELNPRHAIVKALAAKVGKDGAGAILDDAGLLLLDQARLIDGEALADPAAFARRMNLLIERALG